MKDGIREALDDKNPFVNMELGFNMVFDRKYPPGSKRHSEIDQRKALNTSLIHDCQTKQ
jgi:hypothetical protein